MCDYYSIQEVSKKYKISLSSIYRLAKDDPSFPAINIGVKKKIVVHKKKFSLWVQNKNFKEDLVRLPNNTIILRRRINEATADQYQSITKW